MRPALLLLGRLGRIYHQKTQLIPMRPALLLLGRTLYTVRKWS